MGTTKGEKDNVRDSNIEFLRIITIFGVIILHYNNKDLGGGFNYVQEGSLNFFVLHFLESLFICAVNLFVLIMGYYLCHNQKRSIVKALQLLFQVVFFNVIATLLNGLFYDTLSIRSIIGALIPVNYFVILYITLYIISCMINLEAINHTILSFFYIHGLIQFRYYGLLILPCSLTTRLECIAATFI